MPKRSTSPDLFHGLTPSLREFREQLEVTPNLFDATDQEPCGCDPFGNFLLKALAHHPDQQVIHVRPTAILILIERLRLAESVLEAVEQHTWQVPERLELWRAARGGTDRPPVLAAWRSAKEADGRATHHPVELMERSAEARAGGDSRCLTPPRSTALEGERRNG